jgi:methylphosphotriester-DNA--protein-cysteine methyltransferase
MRKLLIAVILILLPAMACAEVWGSAKSKIYHHNLCRWKAQIKPEYRISFASPVEARKAGYQPCGTCRPPGVEPVQTRKTNRKS